MTSSREETFPVRVRRTLRRRLQYEVFVREDGTFQSVVSDILDAHLPQLPAEHATPPKSEAA